MLKSLSGRSVTYVGYTNNLKKRINLHNNNRRKIYKRKKMETDLYEKLNSKIEVIPENII